MASRALGQIIRHAPAALAGPPGARLCGALALKHRVPDTGSYRLTGAVTVAAAPASRQVRLFEFPAFRLVDAAWSDPVTGAYQFDRLPARPAPGAGVWLVFAHDHAGAYDPEAKVGFNLELMP